MWVNKPINLHKWHFICCNSFYTSKLSRTVGITANWTLFTSKALLLLNCSANICTCMIVSCWLLTPGSIWTSLFCHLYSRIPDLVLQIRSRGMRTRYVIISPRRWTVKGKPLHVHVLLAAHAELKCRAVQPMK